MASAHLNEPTPPRATPVVVLAGLTLTAGAGGMALSFLFLASGHVLDVFAGAAGPAERLGGRGILGRLALTARACAEDIPNDVWAPQPLTRAPVPTTIPTKVEESA